MPTYSSDSPVRTAEEDKFSRARFAERVAKVIEERVDPSCITVGLYGAWGDGKTSVLNLIEEALADSDSVISVRFNPWLFRGVENLLLGFFHLLAAALDERLDTKGDKLKDFVKRSAPGIAALAGAKEVGDAIGAFLNGPDLAELRRRIEGLLEASKKRVLVIVDDVDRLEKDEIHAVFKLVKLTADFNHTAYILAFDRHVVASSLSERYSGHDGKSGEQFLEKIIQVPLNLPAVPSQVLRNYCFQGIDDALKASSIELSEQQVQEFVRDFTQAFSDQLSTPRKAKLYGNILTFSLPILYGEVNSVDLMQLEALRVFVPELYKTVMRHGKSFTGVFRDSYHGNAEGEKKRIQTLITDALDAAQVQERQGYIELLKNMFPKLQAVFGNMHYGDDYYQKWHDAQRICAEAYFDRYFSYSIPPGDVGDSEIKALLDSMASDRSPNDGVSQLANLITDQNAKIVIRKLRVKASALDAPVSKRLALAVVASISKVPVVETLFQWDEPRSQAAMLLSDLVMNQPPKGRKALASECISASSDMAFKLEIFRWLRREQEDKPERDALPEKDINGVGCELAEVATTYLCECAEVTKVAADFGPSMFYIIAQYGDKNVLSEWFLAEFSKDSSAIVRLLDMYTPTAWGVETGVSHKSDFERRQYDSLNECFESKFVMDRITEYLGKPPPEVEEFPRDFEQQDRQIVVHQFAWVHRHVSREDGKSEA